MNSLLRKIIFFVVFISCYLSNVQAENSPKVVVVGDEILKVLMPAFLQKVNDKFQIEYVFSDNSKGLLAWAKQDCAKNDVIIFNSGTSEFQSTYSVKELTDAQTSFSKNMREFITLTGNQGCELLWLNIPASHNNNGLSVENLNKQIQEIAQKGKVTIVDYFSFVRAQQAALKEKLTDSVMQKKSSEYLAEILNQWWVACAYNNTQIKRIKLWEGTPPAYQYSGEERINGSARIDHVSVPELELFLPKSGKASTAVIFFPGGGYKYIGFLRNAKDLADILDTANVLVFGLKYRTGRTADVPLLDAQRAVRYVRAHAKEFGIDPHRIGVAGQSAGANLVLNLAGNYSEGDPDSDDLVERESSRPDFMAVFSSWNYGSNESTFSFKPDTPPFFIRHAKDDNSFGLIQKVVGQLEEIGVSTDVLFLEKGGHGAFEIAPQNTGYKWPEDFSSWVRKMNLL